LVLYKKYDINPLSSCLFAIIQIPLLFAFIEAINRTPAIFEGKFLGLRLGLTPTAAIKSGQWWYIILIVILVAVTYFSMNFNQTASVGGSDTEKQMKVMNKVMIVFIAFASFGLSTAICIYWIASSSVTVAKTQLISRLSFIVNNKLRFTSGRALADRINMGVNIIYKLKNNITYGISFEAVLEAAARMNTKTV
jgi:YidC/Oxa1 family membrane protein insertase